MKKVRLKLKHPNRIKFITNAMLIACFAIFTFSSCSGDDDNPPEIAEEIAQEIKDLIYFNGDEKAPTVLINVMSGPSTEFGTDEVDFIVQNFKTTGILTVNVHQAQTLNPSIVAGDDITMNEAFTYNAESIEMLSKVINYFKDEGRTVYVLGISFGAFVTQELIATKGIDIADRFLIIAGRLDINDIMWQALSEGGSGYFENGVTPVLDPFPAESVIERNLARVTAALGMQRYTQRFNLIEDLSTVTYMYGTLDEAVGSLSAEEVQFLVSKNAVVVEGNGSHDETIEGFYVQGFNQAFGIELGM